MRLHDHGVLAGFCELVWGGGMGWGGVGGEGRCPLRHHPHEQHQYAGHHHHHHHHHHRVSTRTTMVRRVLSHHQSVYDHHYPHYNLCFSFMFRLNAAKQLSTDLSRLADPKNLTKLVKKNEVGFSLRIRKVTNLPLGPVNSLRHTKPWSKRYFLSIQPPVYSVFANLTHPWTVSKPHAHSGARCRSGWGVSRFRVLGFTRLGLRGFRV